MHVKIGQVAHLNGGGVGVDRRHIAWATVWPWARDAKALALADGETVHPVVLGQDRAVGVDHRAAANPDALTQKSPGVAGRDEADVVAVRLVGNRQAATGGLSANLRFGSVADGEGGMAQLPGGQHGQHVGLILVPVDRAAQPSTRQPGIVASGQSIGANLLRHN